jgi:hypothetical protein
MVDLASKGLQYFQGKPDYKKAIKNILDLMDNKNFIQTISNMIDSTRGIDNGTADSIIKTSYVQNLISKEIKSSSDTLDKTQLENELKTVIVKSWNGLADKAVEKVKKDLK